MPAGQAFDLSPLHCHCGAEMKIVGFFSKFIDIELTLIKLNIALEEAPPRGPPSGYLVLIPTRFDLENLFVKSQLVSAQQTRG